MTYHDDSSQWNFKGFLSDFAGQSGVANQLAANPSLRNIIIEL